MSLARRRSSAAFASRAAAIGGKASSGGVRRPALHELKVSMSWCAIAAMSFSRKGARCLIASNMVRLVVRGTALSVKIGGQINLYKRPCGGGGG